MTGWESVNLWIGRLKEVIGIKKPVSGETLPLTGFLLKTMKSSVLFQISVRNMVWINKSRYSILKVLIIYHLVVTSQFFILRRTL